jgi:hypothetical protein
VGDSYSRYVDLTIGKMSEADRTEFARLLDLLSDNIATALEELEA